MTTPLTAARRAASLLDFWNFCASVVVVVSVVEAKASLAIAKACMSGVDAGGVSMLDLIYVNMSTGQHEVMAHPCL